VCASVRWNFPLAIFTGQVAAARRRWQLRARQPAEETPLIAAEAIRILREAGVPRAVQLLPGDAASARCSSPTANRGVLIHGLDRGGRAHPAQLRRASHPTGARSR